MIILGIDPGAKGALAWVTREGHLLEVTDMPMFEIRGKLRVSAQGLATAMTKRDVHVVVIEGTHAVPQGSGSSNHAFGYACGLCEGVAAGVGLPVMIIRAGVWKRKAAVPKDKGAARQLATRTWPGAADLFKRVRDDGCAEAALLARWVAISNMDANEIVHMAMK